MRMHPPLSMFTRLTQAPVTTSDTLSLAFGLAATVLAVLAIFVTLYLRHARSVPSGKLLARTQASTSH